MCFSTEGKQNPTTFGEVHLRNLLAVLCVCEKAGDHEQREQRQKNIASVGDMTKQSYSNFKNQKMQFRMGL